MSAQTLAVLVMTLAFATPFSFAQPTSEMLADGVAAFHASEQAAGAELPSMALLTEPTPTGPVPSSWAVRPTFETVDDQQSVHVPIKPGTSLYGTGEVGGPLLRNGRVISTWNYDAYGFDNNSENLYQSHPWVLAVRADGSAYGVLADTTYRCWVDLTDGIRFTAGGAPFRVIVIDRSSPQEVLTALADLVGKMAMPPKWAIGYHQCRYSYYPDSRVKEIAAEFRKREIPCDVIWMDIDYMRGFRCFTFDPSHFPDPSALNADLHDQGFHTVWMIDPGIKKEDGYFVYDQGTEIDAWVKSADGQTYTGDVWPGECVFPDFTMESVRTWWAGLYKDFIATGIDGVWNDMNEPAVFNVESKTMPLDNLHRADEALGGPGTHARFHNVYGLLMVKASREGVMAVHPDRRPFVLSRASYIGGHRYGAAWTGDNTANWEHLEASIPMTLNLGLSGQPFAGPDIGGFIGEGDGQQFARWMGFGALMPFSRGHTAKENGNKEPWSFGPEVEATCKEAIERRYRLMPYLYTLFHEASTTGLPVARPAFFADPTDPALRSEDDSFLLGADLLVSAKVTPERDRAAVRPRGAWRSFDFYDGLMPQMNQASNPDLPDLIIRPGAIIPTGPITQYVDEKPLDPVTLIINLDENGNAEGTLYEDAGNGYGYQQGEFLLTRYIARRSGNAVEISVADQQGGLQRPQRNIRIRIITDKGEAVSSGIDGKPLTVSLQRLD